MTAQAPPHMRLADRASAATSRRWSKVMAYGALFGAAGLALVLPTSTAGAAWYLAGQLLDAEEEHPHPVRIREVSGDTVRLTRTDDLMRQIPLGLTWPGGHARLGEVIESDRGTVVRRVIAIDRGTLRAGVRAYASGKIFDGDPMSARTMLFDDVTVDGELGAYPAWFVPPTAQQRDTWIIAVHGWKSTRDDALRTLPELASSGCPTLIVTYRNDLGAPSTEDRFHHLGNTEWRDVAAAIRYAREHGANDVVLYGWSMGGAIVLNVLRRAEETCFVRAVILDSPVIDWVETLRMHARLLKLPKLWLTTALWFVQRRLNTRLTDLDHRTFAQNLKVPILVFIDSDDRVVAASPTREFAAMRPDLITVVETEDSGHCHSWNTNPQRYDAALHDFLKSL